MAKALVSGLNVDTTKLAKGEGWIIEKDKKYGYRFRLMTDDEIKQRYEQKKLARKRTEELKEYINNSLERGEK